MTRRKRTPPPANSGDRPSKRVAFEIPASLQHLSALSASLARSADLPREHENSAIVARAQAQAQSASPPPPPTEVIWPDNTGKGIYKKRIRWKSNEASFPQEQTWVKPTATVNSGHAHFMHKLYREAQLRDPTLPPIPPPEPRAPLGPVAMPWPRLYHGPPQTGHAPIPNGDIPPNGAPIPNPEAPPARPSSPQHVGKDVIARRQAIIAGLKARSAATIAGLDTRSKQNPTAPPPEEQISPLQPVATAAVRRGTAKAGKPAPQRRRHADDLNKVWNKAEIEELIRRKKEENEKNGRVAQLAGLRVEAQRRSSGGLVTPTTGLGPLLAPRPSFSENASAGVARSIEQGQGTPTPMTGFTRPGQPNSTAEADAGEYSDEDAPGEDDTAADQNLRNPDPDPSRRNVNDPSTDPGDLRELFTTMDANGGDEVQAEDHEGEEGSVSPSAQLLLALAHAAPRRDGNAGPTMGGNGRGGRRARI
jgi:hypothetical protein